MLTTKQFLKDIKLTDKTKNNLENIWKEISEYITRLNSYSKESQDIFLTDYLIKEIKGSSELENELYTPAVMNLYNSEALGNKYLSESLLKLINKTVRTKETIMDFDNFDKIRKEKNKNITYEEYVENEKSNLDGNYRQEIVWIGGKEGIEYALHIPPKPEEIVSYITDFVDYYNNNYNIDNSELYDPIVKAAIAHVIFIKIHPFANGNGRTARILLNHCLKVGINEKYNLDLLYPPLNLSKSFDLTRITYFNKQNEIKYDENIDNNNAINSWINYVIIGIGEQLYYLNSRLDKYNKFLNNHKK